MNDQVLRSVITVTLMLVFAGVARAAYSWLLAASYRWEESRAKRRGEWDPIARKRIPYWDRPRRTIHK